jgi:hypothetical protein
MRPFTLAIPSALLVFAVCLPSSGDQPVFTFSMGIQGGQNFICVICPDGTWQCHRPAPWMRVDASSNGTVNKQGNVPFDIVVRFEPNLVLWELLTPVRDITTGVGCTDNCCASDSGFDSVFLLPQVAGSRPLYPQFVPFWANFGCRPDMCRAEPSQAVVADVDIGVCITPVGQVQSGSVRFTYCRDDFDASGSIDGEDLGLLLSWWGNTYENSDLSLSPRVDLDDSGSIDGADLGILLAHWGECVIPN